MAFVHSVLSIKQKPLKTKLLSTLLKQLLQQLVKTTLKNNSQNNSLNNSYLFKVVTVLDFRTLTARTGWQAGGVLAGMEGGDGLGEAWP